MTDAAMDGTSGSGNRVMRLTAVIVAIGLQLVVLVPFTVASGLMAPLWAIIGLYVLWGLCAAVLVLVARRRPLAAPIVPIVNAILLAAVLTGGERILGWTG